MIDLKNAKIIMPIQAGRAKDSVHENYVVRVFVGKEKKELRDSYYVLFTLYGEEIVNELRYSCVKIYIADNVIMFKKDSEGFAFSIPYESKSAKDSIPRGRIKTTDSNAVSTCEGGSGIYPLHYDDESDIYYIDLNERRQ